MIVKKSVTLTLARMFIILKHYLAFCVPSRFITDEYGYVLQVARCNCVSMQELRLLLPVVTLTLEDDLQLQNHSAFIFDNHIISLFLSNSNRTAF